MCTHGFGWSKIEDASQTFGIHTDSTMTSQLGQVRKSRNSHVYFVRWTELNRMQRLSCFSMNSCEEPNNLKLALTWFCSRSKSKQKKNRKPDNDLCLQQWNRQQLLVARTTLRRNGSCRLFGQTSHLDSKNFILTPLWRENKKLCGVIETFKNKVWCLRLKSTVGVVVLPNYAIKGGGFNTAPPVSLARS